MLLCHIPRTDLLQLLPKGGEVAEIGVAKGDFSQDILRHIRPSRLHLIDPWEHQARDDYDTDHNNASQDEQDGRHQDVHARFAGEIGQGRVAVRRMYSGDAVSLFADGQLDWVYIDGFHAYEGVRADLEAYLPKVKADGFILGHDYTNHLAAQHMKFGVVEAVNEFVIRHGLAFLALTADPYPTYVLARSADSPRARALIATILHNVPFLVEIRDFPGERAFQHKLFQVGRKQPLLLSF